MFIFLFFLAVVQKGLAGTFLFQAQAFRWSAFKPLANAGSMQQRRMQNFGKKHDNINAFP
ncbi:hypothetical protein F4X88_05985 [Candidatus Poribacteria bacterium]|nr:hypothetical protein [Candidatus Poribacteria bacterium]MYA55824.1 hypothetical protein [Candidatus Poribacteria bacterium]